MNVPRPLLVVVVVIIVLGVIACGAGVIRGRIDATGPTPRPTPQFDGFGDSSVPPRDVTDVGDGCDRTGAVVTITGGCLLRVDPQSLRPRSLRLRVTNGSVDVVVQQSIRGYTRTSDSDSFSVGQQAKISVAGTSPVDVILTCGSCQVQISG